jgi:hypothetical protein
MPRTLTTGSFVAPLLLLLLATPAAARSGSAGGGPDTLAAQRTHDAAANRCHRWVAKGGKDSWPGTAGKPWATLQHATNAVPDRHCVVFVRNGVYTGSNEVDRTFHRRAVFRALHPYRAIIRSGGSALDVGSGAALITFAGFQFEQERGGGTVLVYVSSGGHPPPPRGITLRNNIFHDSYGDDVLKLRRNAHGIKVVGNILYNQADNEQLMDVNGVHHVTIMHNIFFEDFHASGRSNSRTTKHCIVVKDSDPNDSRHPGSSGIRIAGNVFLHYEGDKEALIALGNDGKPYYEAKHVRIFNNLMIGDNVNELHATLNIFGARDVGFFNNTIVGNERASAYAFSIDTKGSNPRNRRIWFANNIWDDPTGTMGDFTSGNRSQVTGLSLRRNLYWNRGRAIPKGELIGPGADRARIVKNPRINPRQSKIVLPLWRGRHFASGRRTIRAEFVRLVRRYGRIPGSSPAARHAVASIAPPVDILGHRRGSRPDIGAFEA